MVKKIKKRIEKTDGELEAGETSVEEVSEGATFDQQMDALAEDQLTTVLASGAKTIASHRGLIIAAAVICLATLGGMQYFDSARNDSSVEAATSFNTASESYLEALPTFFKNSRLISTSKQDPAARLAALTAAAAGESSEGQPEKLKAVLEKAAQDFEQTATNYGGSAVAALAQIGRASTKYDLGDADGAATAYNDVANSPTLLQGPKVVALEGMASALENKGDTEGALKAWETIGSLNKGSFGLMAGLQRGRILVAAGRQGDAVALYRTLETEHKAALESLENTAKKEQLARRIKELESGRTSK